MKTDREQAMEWWNSHKFLVHQMLAVEYFGINYLELTEPEIVEIWKNEL